MQWISAAQVSERLTSQIDRSLTRAALLECETSSHRADLDLAMVEDG
jgi:hypothetical protein